MTIARPLRSTAKILATAALTLAALVPATGAQAATGCTRDTAPSGAAIFWCSNVYGAPVYQGSNTGKIVGWMYSTHSWFACRYDYGADIGGPHPHRWLYTQADNGAWGMMRDTDIYSETDPVQVCP
ncbi:hypothetical protein [Streptomyces sp. NPDC060031]|uniref:hypothetical protein n=1 Tax=Streptomyces sp. NPDC060031 TaxID=3347043 RepID=UPI00369C311A